MIMAATKHKIATPPAMPPAIAATLTEDDDEVVGLFDEGACEDSESEEPECVP